MSSQSNLRTHLQGIAGALRFAWIPTLCAVVVALASEDARGRQYGIALAVASLVLGVAFHAREILRGRAARRRTSGEVPTSTAEWMLRLR